MNSEAVNLVLAQVSANTGRFAAMAKAWAAAQSFVHAFGQDTELTRSRVLEFADGGKITELVAAVSVLSGIETTLIGRLVCDQNTFGVMILCKATNLDWSITHAALSAGPSAKAHADQRKIFAKILNACRYRRRGGCSASGTDG